MTMSFNEIVRNRHSVRAFNKEAVDQALIMSVLDDARMAPSNCNTQPWLTHVVSGQKIIELGDLLTSDNEKENFTPDFTFEEKAFVGALAERRKSHGKLYYEALGVRRGDMEARKKASARNFRFYGAPHVALLFMPSIGDNVRVGSDVGMYAQTFLLSLVSKGLGGVPQTVIGFFAGSIREFLGISDEHKMLFAISFGYPDLSASVNSVRTDRAPLEESVFFHV